MCSTICSLNIHESKNYKLKIISLTNYNITFVSFERSLAETRRSLVEVVLYFLCYIIKKYKTFFVLMSMLYQHSWKLQTRFAGVVDNFPFLQFPLVLM